MKMILIFFAWQSVLLSVTTDMSPTGDLLVTNFVLGKCPLELAQGPSRVALAWHKARGITPFGVTNIRMSRRNIFQDMFGLLLGPVAVHLSPCFL